MTNKVPEIGVKYISINDYGSGKYIIEVKNIREGRVYPKGHFASIALKTFFDHYEELPEKFEEKPQSI